MRGWGPPRGSEGGDTRGRGNGRGRGAPAWSNNPPFAAAAVSSSSTANVAQDGRPSTRGSGLGERGRGRGGRGRGARRGYTADAEDYDLVITRDSSQGKPMSKCATNGAGNKLVRLSSNYVSVTHKPDWAIFHYRVDFKPDQAETKIKKDLFRPHRKNLAVHIFDGNSLYTCNRLHPDPMLLYSDLPNQEKVELSIRLVAELASTDAHYLQVFNIIMRNISECDELGFTLLGRDYFDFKQVIRMDAHHLKILPGLKTTMRNHENGILLGIDINHKVLRTDNCLQVINNLQRNRRGGNPKEKIKDELVGSIVMTDYGGRYTTYKVDDIDWTLNPTSTFEKDGKKVSFMEYYRDRYGLTITDRTQPLLISLPNKRDLHRGMNTVINLVPELAYMTGLSDDMRSNRALMTDVSKKMILPPKERVGKIGEFIQRIRACQKANEELEQWGLRYSTNLVQFDGHQIQKQEILFGGGAKETPNDEWDWSNAFKNRKRMISTVELKYWIIVYPPGEPEAAKGVVLDQLPTLANANGFIISAPKCLPTSGDRGSDYAAAITEAMNKFGKFVQMFFVILPRQSTETYSAVKRKLCVDYGVHSQCFVARNALNANRVKSILTKVAVQMNAKLGGVPWSVDIPLKGTLVVGFDVYHCGKRRGASVGAMVAAQIGDYSKYFSSIKYHSAKDELSAYMASGIATCLDKYRRAYGSLPTRIVFYRDGVGEGQLTYVVNTELANINTTLENLYAESALPIPKFTCIVVSKRIHTRFFRQMGSAIENPLPGTVADDVVTLPERYDFFLASQYSRGGTVAPVSYHVIHDRSGLSPDVIQKLTFKLCHLYYNWSGTVKVPAPCLYAHKLAYFCGVGLGNGVPQERLCSTLHFL